MNHWIAFWIDLQVLLEKGAKYLIVKGLPMPTIGVVPCSKERQTRAWMREKRQQLHQHAQPRTPNQAPTTRETVPARRHCVRWFSECFADTMNHLTTSICLPRVARLTPRSALPLLATLIGSVFTKLRLCTGLFLICSYMEIIVILRFGFCWTRNKSTGEWLAPQW